jgi:hypothetical protein
MKSLSTVNRGLGLVAGVVLALSALLAFGAISVQAAGPVASSPPDLATVIGNIRLWAMGILAALATLFLTIGGIRYLTAGGNPRAVEEAKGAVRNAMIGYALAALAPLITGILQRVVG